MLNKKKKSDFDWVNNITDKKCTTELSVTLFTSKYHFFTLIRLWYNIVALFVSLAAIIIKRYACFSDFHAFFSKQILYFYICMLLTRTAVVVVSVFATISFTNEQAFKINSSYLGRIGRLFIFFFIYLSLKRKCNYI